MLKIDELVKLTETYSSRLANKLNFCNAQVDENGVELTSKFHKNSRKVVLDVPCVQPRTEQSARLRTETYFTDVPLSLLKHSLRDYQLAGVKWMRSCYMNKLNVLLADEMGLGKTIQTISLISLLAMEFGNWGPHLVVVPTSVMLNWEVEFKKWCPALKVFTYYGSVRERQVKRHGWSKPNSFHVCITSYKIVTQDHGVFRRKNWQYLILDEAHMIKNWRSQRWQTLLNFSTQHRLLITGTPLQNELMELWALMHFLMPDLFDSHSEFKDWFASPLTAMVDGSQTLNETLVSRLHAILRPFVLRRLKSDVEKSLPSKYEHVIRCPLSKRQRRLYEEYISSSDTVRTLSSGNVMGVMNCLMQLRKVCNHPDLFAGRHISSSYDMGHVSWISFCTLNRSSVRQRKILTPYKAQAVADYICNCALCSADEGMTCTGSSPASGVLMSFLKKRKGTAAHDEQLSTVCARRKVKTILNSEEVNNQVQYFLIDRTHDFSYASVGSNIVSSDIQNIFDDKRLIALNFTFIIPRVRASVPVTQETIHEEHLKDVGRLTWDAMKILRPIRATIVRQILFFPDKRLVQFDCGKLQALAVLLRTLKVDGHKVLIFTQMTKMLDILETFLNLHGYTYCRLDGSTSTEHRQLLLQRFNSDNKVFAFILSTRSGGFGINLTGADTVVFYDSDWNPAMDQQAQDRCHRIGQTREVHIYRLISQGTIEESILEKALQKRELDTVAIQLGNFNTDALAHAGKMLFHRDPFQLSNMFK